MITQISHGMNEIKLGSLEPTRDFTYVLDTAEAFVKALDAPDIIGKTINLGTNFEISIASLVQMIAKIMNADINVIADTERVRPKDSEVERLWSDNTLAKKLLEWKPQFSDTEGLRKGLEKTIAWFSDPINQKMYKPGSIIYNMIKIDECLTAIVSVLGPTEEEIPLHKPEFGGNEWAYVKSCIDSGWVSSVGEYVNLFEQELVEYTGAPYAVAVVMAPQLFISALFWRK